MGNINAPDNTNPAPNYTRVETFANPLNLDANNSNSFYCEITGDTTLNLLNARVGATYLIQLDMDAVGGHTVTLASLFRAYPDGVGSFDTTANAVNLISVIVGKKGWLIYNITNITVTETTSTTTS